MTNNAEHINEVSIETGTNIYARLESLKNTPAHVLAEFIDNALQSFIDYKNELLSVESNYKLQIDIKFVWRERSELSSVTIKDNAAGMAKDKFYSAFTLAHTPDNTEGLNEFGMGMKTAALWLGKRYTLKTTALGESVEREVCFDLQDVTENQMQTLAVGERPIDPNSHYTEIVI